MTGKVERLDRDDSRSEQLAEAMRIAEALVFAADAPLTEEEIGWFLPAGIETSLVMTRLEHAYAARGITLQRIAGGWAFRTALDLGDRLARKPAEPRRLTRAALETLAIIAYHQPVTRADIEDIRGVATSKGTLDALLEQGIVRLRGRRRTPGRPLTYGTTPAFLALFGLERIDDLPGLEDLRATGFIEGPLARGLSVPMPTDSPELTDGEDPLDDLLGPLDGDPGPVRDT
jgi:segregation and condensation protein B